MFKFEICIEKFLFHCKYEKNLSGKTQKAYATDLKQFLYHLHKSNFNEDANKISSSEIKSFLQSISIQKPKTIRRKIASLKAIFNYLNYEEIITVNPILKLKLSIKSPISLPVVMDINDVKKILRYGHNKRDKIIDKHSFGYAENLRNLAVLEMLFATGARVSELADLKPKNIDFKKFEIKLLGKGSKERIIQICNKEAIQIILEYYEKFKKEIIECDNFFINKQKKKLSDQSIRTIVKKSAIDVNIRKHVTPHTYRHTFATLLLEQGVDVKYIQQLLGHSSITTTQIYTHVSNKKQREILLKKHPRHSLNLVF